VREFSLYQRHKRSLKKKVRGGGCLEKVARLVTAGTPAKGAAILGGV